jgi:DNA-binding response OmpR family regulator
VIDSYVAMLSGRSYREGLSTEDAFEELQRNAGTQFDPEVMEVLILVIEQQKLVLGANEKPCVLLVGTDQEFAKLLQFRLLNAGMRVETLENLQDATLEIAAKQPNLVLAEIAANDEDTAFQLLRDIREDVELSHMPFAFVAPGNDRIVKVRALRQGVDDFLVKSENLEELVARIENILTREATRRGSRATPRRRGISGDLENLSLPDVFQMLTLGMKTACVTITSKKRKGMIWFKAGRVVHAKTGKKKGPDAIFDMLRWKTGGFLIEHGVASDEQTVDMDTMFLLMEGLRMIDEECAQAARANA